MNDKTAFISKERPPWADHPFRKNLMRLGRLINEMNGFTVSELEQAFLSGGEDGFLPGGDTVRGHIEDLRELGALTRFGNRYHHKGAQ